MVAVNGAAGPEARARAAACASLQRRVAGPRPKPARPKTAAVWDEPAAAKQVLQRVSAKQERAQLRGGCRARPRAPRPRRARGGGAGVSLGFTPPYIRVCCAARAGGGAGRAAPTARVLRVPVLHLPQGANAAGAGAAGAQLPRLPAGAPAARPGLLHSRGSRSRSWACPRNTAGMEAIDRSALLPRCVTAQRPHGDPMRGAGVRRPCGAAQPPEPMVRGRRAGAAAAAAGQPGVADIRDVREGRHQVRAVPGRHPRRAARARAAARRRGRGPPCRGHWGAAPDQAAVYAARARARMAAAALCRHARLRADRTPAVCSLASVSVSSRF